MSYFTAILDFVCVNNELSCSDYAKKGGQNDYKI